MKWHIVRLDAVAPTPWRNGGGSTRELVAWPHGEDWAWRLSVAEVAADGPFSRFDGVERWFAVLGGQGVRLDVAGQVHVLDRSSDPLCFDGAVPTFCSLIDGPTQDFNLMTRRGRAHGWMSRVSGERQLEQAGPRTLAIYVVEGPAWLSHGGKRLELPAHSLAWRPLEAAATVLLSAPSALWMEIE
jgi:environmental stress-induced protein Ves